MRTLRKLALLVLLGSIAASNGCASLAEALLYGLFDDAYERQFPDGRGAGGLTRGEKRARFEEGSIRFMTRERAYSEEGRVPGAP
jgi:hypothetical protein